jgi:hypothetical protein
MELLATLSNFFGIATESFAVIQPPDCPLMYVIAAALLKHIVGSYVAVVLTPAGTVILFTP